MARLQFRLTNIALDAEEDVIGATAVARRDAYEVITGILGEVETTARERGNTEMTIALSIQQMRDLFAECGRMNGYDPRSRNGGHEIYDSLSLVFFGVMGE